MKSIFLINIKSELVFCDFFLPHTTGSDESWVTNKRETEPLMDKVFP